MPLRKAMLCLSVLSLLATNGGGAFAQSAEGVDRPEGEPKPVGYLPEGDVDFRLLAGPPPVVGSVMDNVDMATSMRFQAEVTPERWAVAQLDAKTVYPRFDEPFGKVINRATSPKLIHLLNRTLRDAKHPVSEGKKAFQRPRPYQRYQLLRRCGSTPIPAPDTEFKGGSSYPSGHTVEGWATALVLAEVAPERAAQILDRAREYGLSRVICGYHFPTDVEAARAIATSVLARLHGDAAFMIDLRAAQAEYRAAPSPASTPAIAPAPVAAVREKETAE